MRLLCFFGSGISRPSGTPMADGITKALFTGKWHKHTNGLFYPVPDGMTLRGLEVALAARGFLQYLAEHTSTYLAPRDGGDVNYEHLFSLAETIKHDVIDARVRPEVGDFVEKTSKATEHLCLLIVLGRELGTTNLHH